MIFPNMIFPNEIFPYEIFPTKIFPYKQKSIYPALHEIIPNGLGFKGPGRGTRGTVR